MTRRRLLALLALLLAALAAGPAAAQDARVAPRAVLLPGIGTADPRRPVDPRAEPWRALGRVQLEVGGAAPACW